VSLLLTFPYDVLGRCWRQSSPSSPRSSADDHKIGPSLPLGLYMGDIVYETPPTKDSETGTAIQIDAVRIKPA